MSSKLRSFKPEGRMAVARRLGIGLAALLALMGPARADTAAIASYVINLSGINIATANVSFTDDKGRYAIDIDADVSGVGTLVARGSAKADSEGRTRDGALAASDFNLTTHANGEDFSVKVQYASGNATGFQVAPPLTNNVGRVPLERKDLRGVLDPVGAFILQGKALGPDLCNRTLKIFTGMERYDIDMHYAAMQQATSQRTGYQGPVVLCRLRYVPISGHFKQSEMTAYLAKSKKILIWYAPLANSDYFIPYRVLMGTSVGDLSMVLTDLK